MSNDYVLYKNATDAINILIVNAKNKIADLRTDISDFEAVLDRMDIEFKKNLDKKDTYIG